MTKLLRAEHVSFRSILQYPEISVTQGKATFIQGPSGCGKSTLLKLFNATLSSEEGELFYKGIPYDEIDTLKLRREVLLVGQSVFLFDGTIADNFRDYYNYRELMPPSAEEMKFYLELCCTDFTPEVLCDTLSGGERQRVYIAICLSFLPQILMLDEPTSALDAATADHLMDHLKKFCMEKEMTLLVVSHDLELTKKYADETLFIDGKEVQ